MGKRQIDKTSASYKKYKRRKILFSLEVVLLIILCIAAFFYIQVQKKLNSIQMETLDSEIMEFNEAVETDQVIKGYTNIALFGADTRENDLTRTNTDTIIIASINNDTKVVKLVSVYRDTYLYIGGDLWRKANAAYANGGPEWALNMLNTNFDLDIKSYVTVDFNALVEVIDLLGGLEITVDEAECEHLNNYCVETSEVTGKSYERLPGAGTYEMNGVQAVAYTRIRYTAGNDFKRTQRQREVIAKIVAKAKTASISTLNKILDTVFPMVKTNLTKSEILSMGMNMLSYELGETTGFPFTHKTTQDGESNEIPITLESNVDQLHTFLFGDEDYTPSQTVKERSQETIERTGYDENTSYSDENFTLSGDEVEENDDEKKKEIESQEEQSEEEEYGY